MSAAPWPGQNGYVGAVSHGPQSSTTPAQLPTPAVQAQIVAAVPADASTDLSNAAEISGKIALIELETPSCDQQIDRAEAAGAVAVIEFDNAPDRVPVEMGDVTGSIGADTIPSLGFFNDGLGKRSRVKDVWSQNHQPGDRPTSDRAHLGKRTAPRRCLSR